MRILIIGYSGAGKSTLAKILGNLYNIPVLHLDNVAFNEDFSNRSDEEMQEIVNKFLNENENWIIDGNYSRICSKRFAMADKIFFLNFNRVFCYFSGLKRYLKYRGKIRDSFPCKERFDLKFQRWILFEGRTKKRKAKHLENFNSVNGERLVFKNRGQVNKYIKKLEQEL